MCYIVRVYVLPEAAGRVLVGCKGEPLNLVLEEVEKG